MEVLISSTTNPWIELPAEPPYQLPSDVDRIERFNQRARPDFQLQLDLLPEPFIGSVNASVLLLNLNPGFSEADQAVHARCSFQTAVRRTLRHEVQPYPFYYLDPEEDGPGHAWVRQRLRPILERVPLQCAAANLLTVEYLPYHSRRFAHAALRLPSQDYSFDLVRRALARDALVVLLRGERIWLDAVPELARYSNLYRLRSQQNVTVSPRNCPEGFERMVEALLRAQAEPRLTVA